MLMDRVTVLAHAQMAAEMFWTSMETVHVNVSARTVRSQQKVQMVVYVPMTHVPCVKMGHNLAGWDVNVFVLTPDVEDYQFVQMGELEETATNPVSKTVS